MLIFVTSSSKPGGTGSPGASLKSPINLGCRDGTFPHRMSGCEGIPKHVWCFLPIECFSRDPPTLTSQILHLQYDLLKSSNFLLNTKLVVPSSSFTFSVRSFSIWKLYHVDYMALEIVKNTFYMVWYIIFLIIFRINLILGLN